MIRSIRNTLGLAIMCLCIAGADKSSAHPHVWVTMKSELIYAADGTVSGVRHTWAFDDAYSVFGTQGLKSKRRGMFTREELAPLAEVSMTSLKEYSFFTFAKADGKKAQLKEPVDYYFDYDARRTVLTLHFTLPFKAPVKAKQLDVEIYDATYFVDFAFAEKDPVALVGAPAGCKFSALRPQDASVQSQRLSESFFNSPSASGGWGAQFANKILVKCP
jgi:ABC-type uncharacterized transport system substrate-binding protein